MGRGGGQKWEQRDQLGAAEAILVRYDGGLDHGGCSVVGKKLFNSGYIFKAKL